MTPPLDTGTDPRPAAQTCATGMENYPDASDWPWRYAHAASIEGAHWNIYTAIGDINRDHFIGMVEYEANARAIVDAHNAAILAPEPSQ